MLALMGSLSKLFSENDVPYLDYRLAENLFCKYFPAFNDARSCTAYDARLGSLGIGIKTFILKNDASTEKIAEFNKASNQLKALKGDDLARRIGEFRNERMRCSNDTYDVTQSIYHIVGRAVGSFKLFNLPYDFVDVDNITDVQDTDASIKFFDGKNHYSFNKSKSVLLKKFETSSDYKLINVDFIEDPFTALEELLHSSSTIRTNTVSKKGVNYVVLPLYSTGSKERLVRPKSGLNQWNASGRPRNENEVYIPVPRRIHTDYPEFFPSQEVPFNLRLPDGNILSAKICQQGGKALMSNPNSALGEWILRKILKIKPGRLVTISHLDIVGIDSVIISKYHINDEPSQAYEYSIQFSNDYEQYETFLE